MLKRLGPVSMQYCIDVYPSLCYYAVYSDVSYLIAFNQANDLVLALMRRHWRRNNVASTSVRRNFDVMCPVGSVIFRFFQDVSCM